MDYLQGRSVILPSFSATSRLLATVVRTLPYSGTDPTALRSYSMGPSVPSVVVARASTHSATVLTQDALCFSVLSSALLFLQEPTMSVGLCLAPSQSAHGSVTSHIIPTVFRAVSLSSPTV